MNRTLHYSLQRLKHLDGRDLFAAAVDELLDAARERQEPLIVQEALVSRVKPTACQATITRQRTRRSSSSADSHAIPATKPQSPLCTRCKPPLQQMPPSQISHRHAAQACGVASALRMRKQACTATHLLAEPGLLVRPWVRCLQSSMNKRAPATCSHEFSPSMQYCKGLWMVTQALWMVTQAHTCVRLLIGLRAIEVALGHIGAADTHLADLRNGHQAILQIQDAHLRQHAQQKASEPRDEACESGHSDMGSLCI